MSLALHGHRPTLSGAGAQFARVISAIVNAPARFIRHRRLLSAMAEMSDYELKDIGLARPDVSDATALRLGSDIGVFLSARARERHRSAVRR